MMKIIVIMSVLMALQMAVASTEGAAVPAYSGTGQYCDSANLCRVWIQGHSVRIQLAGVPQRPEDAAYSESKIANRQLSLNCKDFHREPLLCTLFWSGENINMAVLQHLERRML